MPFWFAALVLATSIVSHVSAGPQPHRDYFEFNSNLTCNYVDREFWHYTIRYMERDFGEQNPDDVIVGPRTYTVGAEDHVLKLEVFHEGGDEFPETGYQVYAEIRHTCTSDQKEALLILSFDKKCKVKSGMICKYDFERNITEFWGVRKQKVELSYKKKPIKSTKASLVLL